MNSSFSKGSLWRKWDLHVHSPYSEHYKGDWEQFKKQIRDADCDVIGINDYFSVEGYKRTLEEIKSGDLDIGSKTLFPVVEMRMTNTVKNKSSKTTGVSHFNFHIIFNNNESELSIEDVEIFIKSLEHNSAIIGSDYSDKTKLENVKVSFDDTLSKLQKDIKFKNNFLIWLPYDEYGGIDAIDPDSDGPMKAGYIKKSDILGSSRKEQIDFFLWKSPLDKDGEEKFSESDFRKWFVCKKPCIKGSDSHNAISQIGRLKDERSESIEKYCWIKADPTFNGLRQITFEPEGRVSIQGNIPQDKPGYMVIDRIELKSDLIYNKIINFNENLNSIIGGRSTGKSVLLSAIGKKLKTEREINFSDKKGYSEYINGISKAITIYWKDGEVNDDREIEFFQQGYMYELARDEEKFNSLIHGILKKQGKNEIIDRVFKQIREMKDLAMSHINGIFAITDSIAEKKQQLLDIGDKKGINKEIERLTDIRKRLGNIEITSEESEIYDKHIHVIEKIENRIHDIEYEMNQIEQLKKQSLLKESSQLNIDSITKFYKRKINTLFVDVRTMLVNKWGSGLDDVLKSGNNMLENYNEKLQKIKSNKTYLKVLSCYKDSFQVNDIENKIKEQRNKLSNIVALERVISGLDNVKLELISKIVELHSGFYSVLEHAAPNLKCIKDDLQIVAEPCFGGERYREILSSALNLNNSVNKELADFKYEDNKKYMEHVVLLFNKIMDSKLSLKGGFTNQQIAEFILSDCFYTLSYDLIYEGDNYAQMSDGKKAFVVLKLLLDFSEKDCPILIDQPEDDLDNRSIYKDLVKYITKKKTKRQVILVSHNPNVVVGADSELVLVANQHGINSINRDGIKFQYKSGSLENSFELKDFADCVLDFQGIKEHVCSILEGGDIAFKQRERRYAIG